MKTWLYLLFLLVIIPVDVMALARFEITPGGRQTSYEERREAQNFLDSDFTQRGAGLRAEAQFSVIWDILSLGGTVDYMAAFTSSDDNKDFNLFEQTSYVALSLPSMPVNLTLVAEQFYTTMSPSEDTFGITNMSGVQYYPYLDFDFANGSTIYLRYPLFGTVSNKEEFSVGVKFLLTDKTATYPNNTYHRAWVFRIDYKDITLNFRGIRAVDISMKTFSAGLGYQF